MDILMTEAEGFPTLAITVGLPRSGKTTLAKRLEKERNYVRVCPDDIRRAIHGEQFIAEAEPFVWATAEAMARALLLGGRSVIVDATNTIRQARARWVGLASSLFITPLNIYLVETPFAQCVARNSGVGSVDSAVMERMRHHYERPAHTEGRLLISMAGIGDLLQACDCATCRNWAAFETGMRSIQAITQKWK